MLALQNVRKTNNLLAFLSSLSLLYAFLLSLLPSYVLSPFLKLFSPFLLYFYFSFFFIFLPLSIYFPPSFFLLPLLFILLSFSLSIELALLLAWLSDKCVEFRTIFSLTWPHGSGNKALSLPHSCFQVLKTVGWSEYCAFREF